MLTASEAVRMLNCLLLVTAVSALIYCLYRLTLRKVCGMLHIRMGREAKATRTPKGSAVNI